MISCLKTHNIKDILNKLFYFAVIIIIFAGIYFRTKLYLTQVPFWFDEMALSISFVERPLSQMFCNLSVLQKAPPIYCVMVFIIKSIFGFNFLSLRFISYLAGVLSLPAFYIFLKNNLKSKIAILIGLYIFSVNTVLTYYSAEFKPYSLDVLICILLLIGYKYIKLRDLTIKKAILYGFMSMLLVFTSFPAMFIIPAIVFSKMIEEKYINKKCSFIALGLIIAGACLYFPDKLLFECQVEAFRCFNNGCFFEFNLKTLSKLLGPGYLSFLIYDFKSINTIPILVLLLFGAYLFVKEKNKIILVVFFMVLLTCIASYMTLYPIYNRLILFIYPSIVLLIVKVFDYGNDCKYKNTLINIILITILFFVMSLSKVPYISIDSKNVEGILYKFVKSGYIDVRWKTKKMVEEILNYSKKPIYILCTSELNDYFYVYQELIKDYRWIDSVLYKDDMPIEETINTFLNNMPKDKEIYIIGKTNDVGFQCPDKDMIIKELQNRKIKFEELEDYTSPYLTNLYAYRIYN